MNFSEAVPADLMLPLYSWHASEGGDEWRATLLLARGLWCLGLQPTTSTLNPAATASARGRAWPLTISAMENLPGREDPAAIGAVVLACAESSQWRRLAFELNPQALPNAVFLLGLPSVGRLVLLKPVDFCRKSAVGSSLARDAALRRCLELLGSPLMQSSSESLPARHARSSCSEKGTSRLRRGPRS